MTVFLPPILRKRWLIPVRTGLGVLLVALLWLQGTSAWAVTTSAVKDLTCAGFRSGSLNCTAGEFTVAPIFSAAPGTAPFCMAGQEFNFVVELGLSGTNTDRQDIGFFVGQQGNDPRATTAGNICSVATFPTSPLPWKNNDSDSCGDFSGGGNVITTIDEIKVICSADSVGALQIPYVLTYWQNNGNICSGPADVTSGNSAKCNAGTASVAGALAVYSGAFVDVTKQTTPDGDGQPFTFTATGPAGAKVIALTGAVLTSTSATGGTYSPATIAAATNSASATLTDGQTVRFYMNALPADRTLTITESATPNWETTAAISCAAVTGAPPLTTDNTTRTITAGLSTTNIAAACTVTNTKRPRITLVKNVGGRVNVGDQFTVSASGGGTLVGTTSATTAGAAISASTTFYSTPNTVLTLTDAKAAGPTALADYDARLTCSNAFAGPGATPNASLPSNLSTTSASITPAPGDDITCTYTNTPKPRITLQNILSVSGGGRVAATDQFTLAMTGATAVTTTGSGDVINSSPVSLVATAGVPLTLTESAAGTTNLSNYAGTYSCVNSGSSGTAVTPGSGASFGFTPANNDVIACSFTNTRKSAALTLAKTWTNAILSNAVNVSASGINNRSFASIANTGSETDTDSGTLTVYAGESIALAEAFTTGNATDYTKSLSCSGSNGLLSHTADSLSGTLMINGADTMITCTFSNDRKLPSLTFLKSVQVTSDPVNGGSNPKFIPGAEALYTLNVTNSGSGSVDNNTLTVIDPVPANTELFTGNLSGGAPFIFTNGTPSSGLTCVFAGLSDSADCVDFSAFISGSDWSYIPNGGFDPNVKRIRFIPAGSMSGDTTPGSPSPNFNLQFRVRVQ